LPKEETASLRNATEASHQRSHDPLGRVYER
jgi:hypothetical protein